MDWKELIEYRKANNIISENEADKLVTEVFEPKPTYGCQIGNIINSTSAFGYWTYKWNDWHPKINFTTNLELCEVLLYEISWSYSYSWFVVSEISSVLYGTLLLIKKGLHPVQYGDSEANAFISNSKCHTTVLAFLFVHYGIMYKIKPLELDKST